MSRLIQVGTWQSFYIVYIADHPQKVLIRRKTALCRGAGMTDNRPGFDILHALAQSNPHNRRSLRHSERRERGGKTPEVMRILCECRKV